MGLDAYVFRNKANLPFDADAVGAVVAVRIIFPTSILSLHLTKSSPTGKLPSIKGSGTFALIHILNEQASQFLEKDSIVLSQVLYGGSHCGDSIPVELMLPLQDELFRLGRYAEQSDFAHLKQFVTDMLELVEAAKREGNPISF